MNNHIENALRANLLLRLLGVYNISKMDPLDQTKIFGLLYKSIGTSDNNATKDTSTILSRFLNAL